MKKLAQGFNTAAQDSNPGSRSRESETLSSTTALFISYHTRHPEDDSLESSEVLLAGSIASHSGRCFALLYPWPIVSVKFGSEWSRTI